MGIAGLLPQLKPIQNPVSLHRYEGQTLGIDGYAWLHRAACSCAMELAMDKPSTKYLQFFIKRIGMLKSFKIEPYFIFDGDAIGVKKDTEQKRHAKRTENRDIAERLWESGEKKNAMDYFQKCVDITPAMAKCIIDYCKVNSIQYIVAPFEADAQMVYLEKAGMIQGIISEDSDLLVFGCRRLITKLNDFGECIEICKDDFDKLPKKFPLHQLSDEEVRSMVCLSGCDYTNGIPKVGLITAMKLVLRFRSIDRILLHIQREGKLKIPDDFMNEYQLANFAFQYQRVFCPKDLRIVTLNQIPVHLIQCRELYECIGYVINKTDGLKKCVLVDDEINHDIHFKIARGDLSPYDHQRVLVNREHKLQISSKSDLQSIDTFFKKDSQQCPRPKPPARRVIDKIDDTIKRRRLNQETVANNCRSKFFCKSSSTPTNHQASALSCPPSSATARSTPISTPSTQEDVETEVPESQIPTQIPSSFEPQASGPEDDLSEILSEVDEEDKPLPSPSPSPQLPIETTLEPPLLEQQSCRTSAGSTMVLQQFRYSNKREPLRPKSINRSGINVRVPAGSVPANKEQSRTLRGTSLPSACSQSIVVRARTHPTDPPTAQRPAVRTSLSSRFVYRPT